MWSAEFLCRLIEFQDGPDKRRPESVISELPEESCAISMAELIGPDYFWTAWQVLQRTAPRTILPHLAQRLDFLASLALVRGR
jgi:hypothetical protein